MSLKPFETEEFEEEFEAMTDAVADDVNSVVVARLDQALRSNDAARMWAALCLLIWGFHAGLLYGDDARACVDKARGLLGALRNGASRSEGRTLDNFGDHLDQIADAENSGMPPALFVMLPKVV